MKQYIVTGMSCAACVSRVEKAVSTLSDVTSCSVNLLTNSMLVEGSATDTEIIKAVTDAGYGIKSKNSEETLKAFNDDALKDTETPELKKRLISSLVFLLILMYFSMGHMMWGWPLPEFFRDNHIASGLVQLLLTIAIMIINKKFFISGFKSLIKKAPNMDTLVSLGAGAAFIYSTYALFAMTDAQVKGNSTLVMDYMHEFYFESAAMILTLITVGKMLEARSKGKTTNALKGLIGLAPKSAVILKDNLEVRVPIEELKSGDIFIVRPGENIPTDGIIIEGESAINESALTGESIPVDKKEGDSVSAATLNQSGFLKCRATKVGKDTTLSKIIQLVSDSAATKAPIAKIADKVSGIFVPTVITIAVITTLVWLILGEDIGFSLARGISVLVISCPCALGLATPVAIMVGNGIGAKNAILFKTSQALELTGKAKFVALDKTGTITKGEPQVTDIITNGDITPEELLSFAYSLEKKSEHPLAKAILKKSEEVKSPVFEITEFKILPGNGLTALYKDKVLSGGNKNFIKKNATLKKDFEEMAESLANEGKTPLFFSLDKKIIGIIAVADTIKEDSPKAISELQNMGIHVVMLTGDNPKTSQAIGKIAGVDEVIAEVLPHEKEQVIKKLKEKGEVIMVGDGINDAPALTSADIGIAIGAGTDIAIDAADIVLMKNNLWDVPAAIRLSRATLKNIKENLFWAFIYNIIGIPLAAGVWIPIFGWELNPMFGAAAMSLSSFCVVTNALRLNFINIRSSKKDKKIKTNRKEEKNMTEKTLKIEGMMCPHCEARVKKCLEELSGVTEAIVSHEKGTAVVTLSSGFSEETLKQTVEAQGYSVISVE